MLRLRSESGMKIKILASLCVLGMGASATAQDGSESTIARTREGAQQFLREFLPTSIVRAAVRVVAPNANAHPRRMWQGWRFGVVSDLSPDSQSNPLEAIADVVGFEATSPCVTSVRVSGLRRPRIAGQNWDDPPITTGGQVVEIVIDWSRVTATSAGGDDSYGLVTLDLSGRDQVPINFQFDRGTEATRVGFAMEFLRAACVPISATGF